MKTLPETACQYALQPEQITIYSMTHGRMLFQLPGHGWSEDQMRAILAVYKRGEAVGRDAPTWPVAGDSTATAAQPISKGPAPLEITPNTAGVAVARPSGDPIRFTWPEWRFLACWAVVDSKSAVNIASDLYKAIRVGVYRNIRAEVQNLMEIIDVG